MARKRFRVAKHEHGEYFGYFELVSRDLRNIGPYFVLARDECEGIAIAQRGYREGFIGV